MYSKPSFIYHIQSFVCFLMLACSACHLGSVKLNGEYLQVGVYDELYDDRFSLDASWNDYFNYGHSFYWTDGDLPSGLEVTTSGRLIGIPREYGHFNFEVSVYGNNYDGSESWIDSTWYTVFVSQESTNENCPSIRASTVSELYLCLGELFEESVEQNDILELDVHLHVQPKKGNEYNIARLTFTINYDATSLSPVSERLNSSLLREVATYAQATVNISDSEGTLTVTLESENEDVAIKWPGRLMNIPFRAIKNLDQSEYHFEVHVTEVVSRNASAILPEMIDLDGRLEVDEPQVNDEPEDSIPAS